MDESGTVRITLKDVYQQTQSLESSLTSSLSALNITLVGIRSHIDSQDQRNAAADQIHVEHGARISTLESVLQQAQPVIVQGDHETRLRALERFKFTLLGAAIIVPTVITVIEFLLTHR